MAGAVLLVAAIAGFIAYRAPARPGAPAELSAEEKTKITEPFQTQIDSLKQQLAQKQATPSSSSPPALPIPSSIEAKGRIDTVLFNLSKIINGPAAELAELARRYADNTDSPMSANAEYPRAIVPLRNKLREIVNHSEALRQILNNEFLPANKYYEPELSAVLGQQNLTYNTSLIYKLQRRASDLDGEFARVSSVLNELANDKADTKKYENLLFPDNYQSKENFAQAMRDFREWINSCNSRIEERRRAIQ